MLLYLGSLPWKPPLHSQILDSPSFQVRIFFIAFLNSSHSVTDGAMTRDFVNDHFKGIEKQSLAYYYSPWGLSRQSLGFLLRLSWLHERLCGRGAALKAGDRLSLPWTSVFHSGGSRGNLGTIRGLGLWPQSCHRLLSQGRTYTVCVTRRRPRWTCVAESERGYRVNCWRIQKEKGLIQWTEWRGPLRKCSNADPCCSRLVAMVYVRMNKSVSTNRYLYLKLHGI